MPTGRFINLSEYLLQQAAAREQSGKDSMERSARMWARGSYGMAQHFKEHADVFFAQSEKLFVRALGYENTANYLATPSEAVQHIVVDVKQPDYAVA